MDRIKEKMSNLRVEADESHAKVIELQAKVKTLEQENLAREQEVTSLTHKNQVLEAEVEKLESGIKAAKLTADEGAQHGTHNEALQRKLQLLEEEAEGADKNLRETNENLRLTDIKADHYERKVTALESANAQGEEKYEEMAKKYSDVQKELEEFTKGLDNI